MPGKNCCIVNCGSCRRIKNIGIFKLPSLNKNKEWRELWLGEIKKTRVIDKHFQELIEKDHVYICEKHFREDIEICKLYNFLRLKCLFEIFPVLIYLVFVYIILYDIYFF